MSPNIWNNREEPRWCSFPQNNNRCIRPKQVKIKKRLCIHVYDKYKQM